jgi:hypothetical protein
MPLLKQYNALLSKKPILTNLVIGAAGLGCLALVVSISRDEWMNQSVAFRIDIPVLMIFAYSQWQSKNATFKLMPDSLSRFIAGLTLFVINALIFLMHVAFWWELQ